MATHPFFLAEHLLTDGEYLSLFAVAYVVDVLVLVGGVGPRHLRGGFNEPGVILTLSRA